MLIKGGLKAKGLYGSRGTSHKSLTKRASLRANYKKANPNGAKAKTLGRPKKKKRLRSARSAAESSTLVDLGSDDEEENKKKRKKKNDQVSKCKYRIPAHG